MFHKKQSWRGCSARHTTPFHKCRLQTTQLVWHRISRYKIFHKHFVAWFCWPLFHDIQLFCFCQSQKSLQDLHQGYPFRLRVSHAHRGKPKLARGGPHARTLFGSVGLPPDKIRPKRYFKRVSMSKNDMA